VKITRRQLHQIIKENLEQETVILEGKDHPRVAEIVDKLSRGVSLVGDTKAVDIVNKIIAGGGLPVSKIKFAAVLLKDIGKMIKLLLEEELNSFKDFADIIKKSFGTDITQLLTALLLAAGPPGTGLLVDFIIEKLKQADLNKVADMIGTRIALFKSEMITIAGDPSSGLGQGESYA
jgi:hypothetical protein